MPFLIVDNPFVVELRCPQSQLVVRIRGGHDKAGCLQSASSSLCAAHSQQPLGKLGSAHRIEQPPRPVT